MTNYVLNTGIVVLIVNAIKDHGASVSICELPLFAGSHGDSNMAFHRWDVIWLRWQGQRKLCGLAIAWS